MSNKKKGVNDKFYTVKNTLHAHFKNTFEISSD